MSANLPATCIAALRWLSVHGANNGRGRLSPANRELLSRGLVLRAWTSANCWVITLSEAGKRLIEEAGQSTEDHHDY